jgi:hypothetical protein
MKIDYNLNIIGERVDYEPRKEFIEPLGDPEYKIFEITAGNSYGKTFLLNLIAYACFADKLDNKYILKSIKDSISRYHDPEYCNLSYNLEFDLPNGDQLVLSKEINQNRRIKFQDVQITEPTEFHKSVSVLYDVPTDPSERLNAVIKDLGIWNNNLHQKLKNYWEYLRGLQSDFNRVRDESKILELNETDFSFDVSLEKIDLEILDLERTISDIHIITDLTNLIKLQKVELSLDEKLSKAQTKMKSLTRPKKIDKRDEDLIGTLQREKNKNITEFRNILSELHSLVHENAELKELIEKDQKLEQLLDEIVKVDIDELIVSDTYIDDIKQFTKDITDIDDIIVYFVRTEEQGKKYIVNNFLNELLRQIETLVDSNAESILEDLAINNSTILIDEIKKKLSINKSPDFTDIKSFLKHRLQKIKSFISESFRLNVQIKKESSKKGIDANGDKYYKTKAQIDEFKATLKDEIKEVKQLKDKISSKLNINLSMLDSLEQTNRILSGQKLTYKDQEIDNLKSFLKTKLDKKEIKSGEKSKLEESKRMNLLRLELEQKKKTSQFSIEEEDKINKLTLSMQFLIKNLGDFNEVISSINSGNLENFSADEDKGFIDIAGRIIAYSMDNKILRVDGDYIRLDNYDMIKKEFHCEGNVIIRKEDISTGLASANYLRQRIENVEGKFVIILLDEIGNMTRNTLQEVIKSIKKVESQKRLITALLTQPSSEGIKINKY